VNVEINGVKDIDYEKELLRQKMGALPTA